ncbi:MAG: hypothetical protein IPG96_06760 [Proteobacteria bacterium]|jgi:hypothetical protein|nr:hypothetical protein [Pseudomonadota bacterium]
MPRARLRPCPKRRQALLAGTVLLGLLAGATRAAAKASVPLKPVEVERLGGRLRISVGFRELFDAELRQRLDSGFVMTVAQTLALHVTSDARPIVVLQRTLRAVYDLWDEQYLVTIADSAGERRLRLRQQREVVDVLTSWWRHPLAAPTSPRPATGYFFTGLAQVNPISDQALSQVRRWLRRPSRKQRSGGGESFFGSFVSIFVNARIAQAERSFVFRTPAFSLGD